MSKLPKNMFQETNNKDRFIGLTPTPIYANQPNQSTDPNSFLTENIQNINQFKFSAENTLSKGIINNNSIVNPKNPQEYGLYLDRKEFKLTMPLYPNISENINRALENPFINKIATTAVKSPFVNKMADKLLNSNMVKEYTKKYTESN